MKKLNIGCGVNIKEDCINLDKRQLKGVDIIWDLEKFPYPFKNNYFDTIYARQVIEHLSNFERTVGELFRILKPEGRIIMEVPHFSGASAFVPYHKIFFNCSIFQKENPNYPFPSKFLKKIRLRFYKGWYFYNHLIEFLVNTNNLTREAYENTFLCSLFPADILYVEFKKKQGGK